MSKKKCTSWIQHPETGKLIPRDEYVSPQDERHFFAQGDFKSFVSPIDGKVIDDRGKMRRHMEEHGVAPSSEYSADFLARREKARIDEMQGNTKSQNRQRKETIQRILGEYESGK
tara:strand:+ start:37 stop:381 length:345 start_codon:yes stop_codon:yes gene_type:complete